jgi:murein DD-endopeptidase MepM/ murein hydrolase activator NlpD
MTMLITLSSASADEPSLVFSSPVDCTPERCFVQNYVDTDPGEGRRDYGCGAMSYNGHDGTDVRVKNIADMNRGVAVLAMADGTVKAIRDGMADADPRTVAGGFEKGKDCGNGVIIDHGNGWESQMCHLRKGSVQVKPGDSVVRGQKIGMIGHSGNAQFPHVHAEIRKHNISIDPFTGRAVPEKGERDAGCPVEGASTLWDDAARTLLAYAPINLLGRGFVQQQEELEPARGGSDPFAALPAKAPALIGWLEVAGARTGDKAEMKLLAPDGRELVARSVEQPRPQATTLWSFGLKQPATGWEKGAYTARFTLHRAGQEILREEWKMDSR